MPNVYAILTLEQYQSAIVNGQLPKDAIARPITSTEVVPVVGDQVTIGGKRHRIVQRLHIYLEDNSVAIYLEAKEV